MIKLNLVLMFLSLSTTTHILAQEIVLSRTTIARLKTCSVSPETQGLAITKRYLDSIVYELVTNSPDIFKDDLAPEHICVNIDITTSGQRAWALTDSRTISIETGLLLRVQNRHQLAMVLAHELAHVALRHSPLDGTPVPQPERDRTQELLRSQNTLFLQILALGKNDRERIMLLQDQLIQVEREASLYHIRYFGEESAANWTETEADVVGSIYFLRAGFNANEIAWRQDQLVLNMRASGMNPRLGDNQTVTTGRRYDPHASPPNLTAEERIRQSHAACAITNADGESTNLLRGTQRYPLPCWQLWNLRYHLPFINEEVRGLRANQVARPINNSEHQQMQNEVRIHLNTEIRDPKQN